MERFVQFVTGGGVALVVGLWIASLFGTGSGPWVLGGALAALGGGALLTGIAIEIETAESRP